MFAMSAMVSSATGVGGLKFETFRNKVILLKVDADANGFRNIIWILLKRFSINMSKLLFLIKSYPPQNTGGHPELGQRSKY